MNKIKSFLDFIKHTDALDLFGEAHLFRGQNIKGNLIPSVARKDPNVDTTAMEKTIIEQLKLQGSSYLLHNETDLDLLVRAQHFGLKTRLLDWSSNPLVALWFACASEPKSDGYVYALTADNLMTENAYKEDPFSFSTTRVFQPRMNNARIIAQSGWFTLHRFSKKNQKFVPIESIRHTRPHLTELQIPSEYKPEILRSLELHGINQKTLYPDIGGICNYLNWKYNLA